MRRIIEDAVDRESALIGNFAHDLTANVAVAVAGEF